MHERLCHFFVSSHWLGRVPFLASYVVRQANSDHDVVVLDTLGRKPIGGKRDHRLQFRYEACWAKEGEAKWVIEEAWR